MKDATLAQGNQVVNLILQKGVSSRQLQKLLESGLLADLLDANLENGGVDRNAFRRTIGLRPTNVNVFPVTVNYDLPVEAAVAAGKYDWVNGNVVADNFPSTQKGTRETEIVLVRFDDLMGSDDVLHEFDTQGLRAAELPELLAFGEKYPDAQREFPVVALGSVWQDADGDRSVAYLYGDAGKRNLRLDWFGIGWRGSFRFVTVRK